MPSERSASSGWRKRRLIQRQSHGLFTHHRFSVERLPAAVKALLPAAVAEETLIYLRDVLDDART